MEAHCSTFVNLRAICWWPSQGKLRCSYTVRRNMIVMLSGFFSCCNAIENSFWLQEVKHIGRYSGNLNAVLGYDTRYPCRSPILPQNDIKQMCFSWESGNCQQGIYESAAHVRWNRDTWILSTSQLKTCTPIATIKYPTRGITPMVMDISLYECFRWEVDE
jgi:hypothetical protein